MSSQNPATTADGFRTGQIISVRPRGYLGRLRVVLTADQDNPYEVTGIRVDKAGNAVGIERPQNFGISSAYPAQAVGEMTAETMRDRFQSVRLAYAAQQREARETAPTAPAPAPAPAAHNFDGPCQHEACREARGFQCEDCGHYYPANQVRDDGGAYYCRQGMGHHRAGLTPSWGGSTR